MLLPRLTPHFFRKKIHRYLLGCLILFNRPVSAQETLAVIDWETEPAYTWDHDSPWGNQHASWDRPNTGATGKCLRGIHPSGDCKDNRGFTWTNLEGRTGHRLRIRISMACPTGSGKSYWMETSCKSFIDAPANYGENYDQGDWTEVKWFNGPALGAGADGNSNVWQEYSVILVLPGNHKIVAVGFETGSSEGTGGAPEMRWDTLILEDLDGTGPSVTKTFTPTITTTRTNTIPPPSPTKTFSPTRTLTITRTPVPTHTNTTQNPDDPTPTFTSTFTVTKTPSPTPSPTVTQTHTQTPTITKTFTVTNTPTITSTPTITNTPTETPSCKEDIPILRISPESEAGYTPDLATDRFGSSHVVWRNGTQQIWYARVGPNYTVEITPRAILTGKGSRDPKVTVDPWGNAHIVTVPFSADSQTFLTYLKVNRQGNVAITQSFVIFDTWPERLDQIADPRYTWPSIAYDITRSRPVIIAEVHLTAQLPIDPLDPYSPKKYFFRDTITTVPIDTTGNPIRTERWEPYFEMAMDTDPADRAKFPDIAIDRNGVIHATWWHKEPEWTNGGVAYRSRPMPNWLELTGVRQVRNSATVGPEITVKDNGFVDVVWTTFPAGKVIHQRVNNGAFVGGNSQVNGSNSSAKSPNIGSATGTVVSVWADDLDGSHLWAARTVILDATQRLVKCAGTANYGIDSRGNGFFDIVWQDGRHPSPAIYYTTKRFTGPGPTSTPTPLISPTRTPTGPTLTPTRGPSPTPSPTTTLDMYVSRMELVQVVQNNVMNVPLVADKPGVMRAFVAVNAPAVKYSGNIPARLFYSRGGGQIGPLLPSLNLGGFEAVRNPDREKLEHSFNFRLPIEAVRSGNTNITVEVNFADPVTGKRSHEEYEYGNNSKAEDFAFQVTAPRYRIAYYAVNHAIGGPAPPAGKPSDVIHNGDEMFRKAFPIAPSDVEYVYEGVIKWNKPVESSSNEFIVHLRGRWQLAENASPFGARIKYNNQLVAWLPEMAVSFNGLSDPAWLTNPGGQGHVSFSNATVGVDDKTTKYKRTFLHEICHNHDRRHPAQLAVSWMREGLDYGFDVDKGVVKYRYKDPPNDKYWDIMKPALPEYMAWMIPSTYIALVNTMPNFVKAMEMAKSIRTSALMVSGLIYQDGTGVFSPIYQINYVTTPPGPSGDCSLILEDQAGKPLYTSFINPVFYNPDSESWVSPAIQDGTDSIPPAFTAGFHEVMPAVQGLKHIVLRKGIKELDRQTVSLNDPTVTVISPNGGEVWSGEKEIRWDSYDADSGDLQKLSYSVLYSADNKANWRTLETNLTEKKLMVSTLDLPGGTQCYVRVMVTDGINTSEDDSNGPFTTIGNTPLAIISSPPDRTQFGTYELIQFIGKAVDLEEKVAAGDLVWSSDLHGVIGKGLLVETVSLQEGTHTVTLDVTDGDGLKDSASIQIGIRKTWSLKGDLRHDGKLDYLDLLEFSNLWRGSGDKSVEADLDENGKVDARDLLILESLLSRY